MCFSFFSEAISQALRAIFCRDLFNDAARQQAFESFGQDVGGNSFGRGREIFETGATKKKIADDKQGPAVAKNVQRIRHRTRRTPRRRAFFRSLISTGNRHSSRLPYYLLAICKHY